MTQQYEINRLNRFLNREMPASCWYKGSSCSYFKVLALGHEVFYCCLCKKIIIKLDFPICTEYDVIKRLLEVT